ncbi:MAG: YdeI/OmpD-associated family protein [Acidobacteriota bacterium]|nr:YdeI/OmpD-associated family protein [Acidobacteriota bacterium]
MATLIAADPRAKSAWERLTPGSRRMLREHVAGAKQSATRARRAATGLGV